MRKFITMIAVVVLALTLVACGGGKDSSATGYGLVHGHYVGEIKLTVDSKGVVKEAKIEEYYLAYNAAQVKETTNADVFELVDVTKDEEGKDVETGSGKYYAKYYSIDGTLFTNKSNKELKWYNAANVDLETWAKDEANAKAYVAAVKAGKVFVAKADGSKNTAVEVTGNAAVDMSKSVSNYGGTIWDWKAAMKGVEDLFVGSKMDATYSKNADGKWVVNDVVTSATLVDFADYYKVGQRAYATATK